MFDALAGSNVIHIPAKAKQQLAAIHRAEAELERIGPQRASDCAIAQRTQLSVATVRSLRAAARVTVSLDQPVGEDTLPLGDLVTDDRAVEPSENAIRCEVRHEVSTMLRLLPGRLREVRRATLVMAPVHRKLQCGARALRLGVIATRHQAVP
jgi:DNA-directed RNA polymerase sigma subunit (sigma70/sigma32)